MWFAQIQVVEVHQKGQVMALEWWWQSDDLIDCLLFGVNCIDVSILMLHFPKIIVKIDIKLFFRTSNREEVERLEVGVAAPLLELFWCESKWSIFKLELEFEVEVFDVSGIEEISSNKAAVRVFDKSKSWKRKFSWTENLTKFGMF